MKISPIFHLNTKFKKNEISSNRELLTHLLAAPSKKQNLTFGGRLGRNLNRDFMMENLLKDIKVKNVGKFT